MARQPEVFVRSLEPEEAQRLVKITRTTKDRVRLRWASRWPITLRSSVTTVGGGIRRTVPRIVTLPALFGTAKSCCPMPSAWPRERASALDDCSARSSGAVACGGGVTSGFGTLGRVRQRTRVRSLSGLGPGHHES
jgi:hypothetical protein